MVLGHSALSFIWERGLFIKLIAKTARSNSAFLRPPTHPQGLLFSFPLCLINFCSFSHPVVYNFDSSKLQDKNSWLRSKKSGNNMTYINTV
jgi:hypothetical protein